MADLAVIMDGDVCRICNRQVFDLTAMTDGERVAFLAECESEACISYSIPVRPAFAAALAAAMAFPAAASAAPPAKRPPPPPPMVVVAGGIAPPPSVEMIQLPPQPTADDIRSLYGESAPAKTQAETKDKGVPARPKR